MTLRASLASIVGLMTLAQAGVVPAAKHVPDLQNVLQVPEGTPDGVYHIYFDSVGEVALEKIDDLRVPLEGVTARDLSGDLMKRDQGSYTCNPVTLVSNDIERAAYNLGQTCDTNVKVPKKGAQTAVSGQAVVYCCNDARFTTHYCRSSTINTVVNDLEKMCPKYRAGELIFNKGQAPDGNGVRTYGYTKKGNGICYGLTS